MKTRANALMWTLCALVGACGGDIDSSGTGGADASTGLVGLVSISVTPANATLTIDGTTPATSAYTATGTFEDGHQEDITTRVGFRLEDANLGGFAAAQFTSYTDRGGSTLVIADSGTVNGTTGLTVVMHQRVSDPGSTGLPADPAGHFGGAPDPARAPEIVYPNDAVLVPPNLGRLEIHFLPGAGNDLFELTFANDVTDVVVYLACALPMNGGCIYQPDPQVWKWIAETNRGGDVRVSLRATAAAGGTVGASAGLSVAFSRDDIDGGLYYWTTSNGTGIMRFDFASTTQVDAERFLGTQLTGGTCVGCHALSRDGSKMIAEAGGQNDGRTLLLDVASLMPMVPFGSTDKSIFESWNPDGTQYAGVYGDDGATDFGIMLFDGNSSLKLGSIPGTGDATHPADHPDWSPDGSRIVYTRVGTKQTSQRPRDGSIEMVTDTGGGAWGAPVELVPRVTSKNHYYPTFSPDGSFVLYDESTCTNGGGECDADTDPTARLFAVPAAAGAMSIELTRANAPGRMDAGQTALTNTFPKWSPFVFHRTAETNSRLEWVTFSSTRQFGLRKPPAGGGTLLWMAAVDPDQVAAGVDPSYPAFALPFQDLTTSNHIAQWTQKVVPPIQ
jgi:hypothetical protein